MHELSICQALLDQVQAIVTKEHAKSAASITVRLGALSGVEPDLLQHAFTIARMGTSAEQAELVIEALPIRVHCNQCGADSEATPTRLVCGICGDWHTRVISGDEMLLARIELVTSLQ